MVYGRDQDVALDFSTLAKALTKVARGEVRPGPCSLGCEGSGAQVQPGNAATGRAHPLHHAA